jgi:hypothetical protein
MAVGRDRLNLNLSSHINKHHHQQQQGAMILQQQPLMSCGRVLKAAWKLLAARVCLSNAAHLHASLPALRPTP